MPAAVSAPASFLMLSSRAFARYSSVGSSPPVICVAPSRLSIERVCWQSSTPNRSKTKWPTETRKSAARSVKRSTTAKISYFSELPGAEFRGDIEPADVEHAVHMQKIRASYESSGDQEFLWLDCQEMGFESNEICRFAAKIVR
jgi:hypothetical protein